MFTFLGEIPWSSTLKTEIRDFRIFFVHVPGRIYYLIDPDSTSKDWCSAIDEGIGLLIQMAITLKVCIFDPVVDSVVLHFCLL